MNNQRRSINQILDANLNRILEGVRVLEEIARFILSDKALTLEIKNFRHSLNQITSDLLNRSDLHLARDTSIDSGKFLNTDSETRRDNLETVIRANAGRTKEGLRVLEEFSKILKNRKSSNSYKKLRFLFYDLEQELLTRAIIDKSFLTETQLYPIIDPGYIKSMKKAANIINDTGIKLVQLRVKNNTGKKFLSLARTLRKNLKSDIRLLINDRIDIALAIEADGVHLGQTDIDIKSARKILSENSIIGISVDTLSQLKQAVKHRADYIGFGPMYPTRTKPDAGPDKSLKDLQKIVKQSPLPVAVIGGIDPGNTLKLIESGSNLIAVISSIWGDSNPKNQINKFKGIIKKMKGGKK